MLHRPTTTKAAYNSLNKNFMISAICRVSLASAFVAFFCLLPVPAISQTNLTSPIGMNLSSVVYYTEEQPFLNIFKTAQTPWDTGGGTQGPLSLDGNGYPTSMTPPGGGAVYTAISALILRDLVAANGGTTPPYSAGNYVVLYDGTGTIVLDFDATTLVSSAAGRLIYNVPNPTSAGIALRITATDPNRSGDYIRNIRVVYSPDSTSSTIGVREALLNSGQVFDPTFVHLISPFNNTLRFMDWMRTNNSLQSAWANRPAPSFASYGGTSGVPLEIMIALANQLNVYPWFNMPHLATDDYITQFAALAHQQLATNLKVYVEYSNETWNSAFDQFNYVQTQGQATWPTATVTTFELNRNWYGMRTAQMCDIWKSAWGADASRVICVMGSQAGNPWVGQKSLDCPLWSNAPCSSHGMGALAIAPYFGYDVPDAWTSQPDGGLTSLFTEIMQGGLAPGGYPGGMIKQAIDWVTAQNAVAVQYGLDLVAYEGGQSLVNQNDAALSNLYIAANRDSRMGTAYTTYFQAWRNAGGHLFVNFADIAQYTQYGSWGALESSLQTTSPKYAALTSFISANPCWWSGCSSSTSSPPPPPAPTPPPVPTGLTGSAASTTQINTTWKASNGAAGYKVFRNGANVGTTANTSFSDTGLAAGTTYTYAVAAYDSMGSSNPSTPVAVATFTPPTVAITSPANGVIIKGNGSASISATASDAGGIKSITINGDGKTLLICNNVTTCSVTWQGKSISQGTHTISATVIDVLGLSASTSITVTALK